MTGFLRTLTFVSSADQLRVTESLTAYGFIVRFIAVGVSEVWVNTRGN